MLLFSKAIILIRLILILDTNRIYIRVKLLSLNNWIRHLFISLTNKTSLFIISIFVLL